MRGPGAMVVFVTDRLRGYWALFAIPILLSGCIAGVRAGQVTPDNEGVEGLRYFLPAQYLVIEQTSDGQWDARFQSVVDRSREYYVQPYAYLGSGKTTVQFNDDGTLKSFKLVADTTGVPAEVITAVKDVQLKREELAQAEIEAKAKAGFPATKPPIGESARSPREIFLFRIDGDKLHGLPKTPTASLLLTSKQPGAPTYDLPVAVSPRLEVTPGDTDPRTQVSLGIRGEQLANDSATADSLCFYAAVDGKYQEVSRARRDAILKAAQVASGKLVFPRLDLWDVAAIGLAQRGAGGAKCQPG